MIRSINASTTTKIDEIIGGAGQYKSIFDERTKLQQGMALKYEETYKTPATKLLYLHTFADKCFFVDFSTSAVEDGEEDDE